MICVNGAILPSPLSRLQVNFDQEEGVIGRPRIVDRLPEAHLAIGGEHDPFTPIRQPFMPRIAQIPAQSIVLGVGPLPTRNIDATFHRRLLQCPDQVVLSLRHRLEELARSSAVDHRSKVIWIIPLAPVRLLLMFTANERMRIGNATCAATVVRTTAHSRGRITDQAGRKSSASWQSILVVQADPGVVGA